MTAALLPCPPRAVAVEQPERDRDHGVFALGVEPLPPLLIDCYECGDEGLAGGCSACGLRPWDAVTAMDDLSYLDYMNAVEV